MSVLAASGRTARSVLAILTAVGCVLGLAAGVSRPRPQLAALRPSALSRRPSGVQLHAVMVSPATHARSTASSAPTPPSGDEQYLVMGMPDLVARGAPPTSALRGHAAAATAAGCPAAPYGPQRYAPGSGKTVALTFDDGPGRSTAAILAVLARYHVPATFFNIGLSMTIRPALVREELRGGYVLGDHTWDHLSLSTLSPSAQAAELDRVSAEQRALTGTVPCLLRPPSGYYNSTTLKLAQPRRMAVWLWSVDTQDWMADGSGSAYWVQRIIRLAESEGGQLTHPVVLMHNQRIGNPATVSALPTIIEFFRARGYKFVTL